MPLRLPYKIFKPEMNAFKFPVFPAIVSASGMHQASREGCTNQTSLRCDALPRKHKRLAKMASPKKELCSPAQACLPAALD